MAPWIWFRQVMASWTYFRQAVALWTWFRQAIISLGSVDLVQTGYHIALWTWFRQAMAPWTYSPWSLCRPFARSLGSGSTKPKTDILLQLHTRPRSNGIDYAGVAHECWLNPPPPPPSIFCIIDDEFLTLIMTVSIRSKWPCAVARM